MSTEAMFVAMADALGVISAASWPYTITFTRKTNTKSTGGGNVVVSTATTPASVPCRYRPARAVEIQLSGKTVGGVVYAIFVPNSFSDALVDVDSKCTGTIAATTGGEPARTYNVIAPQRFMGLEILILASLEE